MERALRGAGFVHRRELGTQEKTSQELVGDDEPAVRVGFEQTVAAGGPEIGHERAGTHAAASRRDQERLMRPEATSSDRPEPALSPSQTLVSAWLKRVAADGPLGFAVQPDPRRTVHEIESDDILLLDLPQRPHDCRQRCRPAA